MEAMTSTSRLTWIARLLVLVVFQLGGLTAWGQSSPVELVLEQNPPEGGLVTPGSGVHQYAPNTSITVTAVPQPGYRFAYWLGDVSDPGSSTTEIAMTDSKAVVAVFERVTPDMTGDDEEEEKRDWTGAGGGSGSYGLASTPPDFFTTSWSISSGTSTTTVLSSPILIQTPEPTTILLLGLGATILTRRPRSRRYRNRT
jgi:hypothetical protein